MPRYRVDIQKRLDTEYWTNRYFVETATLALAVAAGTDIVARERTITLNQIQFDKMRVDDNIPLTDNYSVVTLAGTGARDGAISLLPLFNVARVDFNVATGRPSRKYLRGILDESSVESMMITPTIQGIIGSNYALPMSTDQRFVDVDGQAMIGFAVVQLVAMRQLRRGSRRRVTPVI